MIFNDLTRIYHIYHIAAKTIVLDFKNLNSKIKVEAFAHYEYFLEFNKDFQSFAKSIPCLMNFEFKVPDFYKEKVEVTKKMKKQLKQNKANLKTNVENFDNWDEEIKGDNLSEEYDLDNE